VKLFRNRLGNIGKRLKDSPKVRRRGQRNVYEAKSMTEEELVLKMKKVIRGHSRPTEYGI
jgi:hypothetical protein